MNETTTSPIIMALLFVLRCLIPLGLLFGISYLLRRLELVIDRSDQVAAPIEITDNTPTPPAPAIPEPKVPVSPRKKKTPKSKKNTPGGKKRTATSKKKKES